MHFINKLSLILIIALLATITTGCDEDIKDVELAQFNKPKSVALICYDDEQGALPISSCSNSERTDAQIYAFVTQTEYGEVAIINLEDYRVVDQEQRIPFNSYVPVGGQPTDIATSHDGKKVYTTNSETMDISIIDVNSRLSNPTIAAAESITIGTPPAQILIASDTGTNQSLADKYAFVTEPTAGHVALVNLEEYSLTINNKKITIPRGVLAYLRLDAGTLSPTPVTDNRPEGIAPYSMVASTKNASFYVGGLQSSDVNNQGGNYIAEIHSGSFIKKAVESYISNQTPVELDAKNIIVRRLNLGSFTSRDISIEPELERWLYIAENELGGIIVLDLITGQLMEINDWNPNAENIYSLHVPGIAKHVKLMRLSDPLADDEYPDPYTFNGTFAVVSTTQSAIFVIDAEIDPDFASQIGDFTAYPHSLHSKNQWYETISDDDEEPAPLYPEISEQPELYADEQLITLKTNLFAPPVDQDTDNNSDTSQDSDTAQDDDCSANPQGFRMTNSDDNYNIFFRCDRRISTAENWHLVYQGAVGISGVGILQTSDDSSVVFTDEYKDFCEAGLLGPAGNDLWGQFPADSDSIYFEGFRNYPGDMIKITSKPTPMNPDEDCDIYDDDKLNLMYRVTKIVDSSTITIKTIKNTSDVKYAPLPTKKCFGQAFTYEVLTRNSFVLTGHASGNLKEGSMAGGKCVPWSGDPANFSLRINRVFEDIPFTNLYLKFQLNNLDDLGNGLTRNDVETLVISLNTINGFQPMYSIVGSDITDIEVAPDSTLVLIDQSLRGLILFDMVNTFQEIADPIH